MILGPRYKYWSCIARSVCHGNGAGIQRYTDEHLCRSDGSRRQRPNTVSLNPAHLSQCALRLRGCEHSCAIEQPDVITVIDPGSLLPFAVRFKIQMKWLPAQLPRRGSEEKGKLRRSSAHGPPKQLATPSVNAT